MKALDFLITAVIFLDVACKPTSPVGVPTSAPTSEQARAPARAPGTAAEVSSNNSVPPTADASAKPTASPVATTSTSAPMAPNLMVPSRHGSEITFSWSKPEVSAGGLDVVSYNLQIASPGVNSANPLILFSGNLTALSKTVTGLNGQQYFAKVQAVDANGRTSEFSPASQVVVVDTENPANPEVLRVLKLGDPAGFLVTLEYQESHDNMTALSEMSYSACSSKNAAEIDTLVACQNSATSAGVPPVKGRPSIQFRIPAAEATGEMNFRVIAEDEAGNKSISNIKSEQFLYSTLPAD